MYSTYKYRCTQHWSMSIYKVKTLTAIKGEIDINTIITGVVYHPTFINGQIIQSKNKNNKYFSWVTDVRVLSSAGNHSPPYLPRMPSNTVLISGPAVGATHILIWSYSRLECVLASNDHSYQSCCVFFCGSSQWPFIYPIHRVCLVDHVDLTCSMYSWLEGFESSSVATLPRVSIVVLFSPLHVGCPLGFSSGGCPEGLGSAPVRPRCGGDAAAWVAGFLAAPGTQGGWRLGQQEI